MPDDLKTGIGASVKRKEDLRFITGKGNYTDDINRPGQLYAYMLRSNVASGSIKLDISEAKNSEGVYSIFVGNDMEVIQELVTSIRAMRSRVNIPPSKSVKLIIKCNEHKRSLISQNDELLISLAKLDSYEYNDSKDTESKVVNATNDLIDVREDMKRQIAEFDIWAEEQSQLDPLMVTGLDEKKEEDK